MTERKAPSAAEGEGEMSDEYDFSKRSIIIFIIVMIAATALTVEGVYFALKTFVLDNAKRSGREVGRAVFGPERG